MQGADKGSNPLLMEMPTTGYEYVVCVRKSLQQYLIAPLLKNLQLLCIRRLRILGANSNITN